MPQISSSLLPRPVNFTNGRMIQTAYTTDEIDAANQLGLKETTQMPKGDISMNLPGTAYVPKAPIPAQSAATAEPIRKQPHNRFADSHPHLKNPTVRNFAEAAIPGENTEFPHAAYHQQTGESVVIYSPEEMEALGPEFGKKRPMVAPRPTPAQVTTESAITREDFTASLMASHLGALDKIEALAGAYEELEKKHNALTLAHDDLVKQLGILSAQVGEIGQQVFLSAKSAVTAKPPKSETPATKPEPAKKEE